MNRIVRLSDIARIAALIFMVAPMISVILSAGRSLTGDAPALMARASRIADVLLSGDPSAIEAWLRQTVPQPPLGYLPAMLAYLMGLEQAAPIAVSAVSLALVGLGLTWAGREERSPLGVAPLAAGLMFCASPMTWTAAEHVQWDLTCAAWICLSLGALARSRDLSDVRWAVAAGVLSGLAALVKYNAVFFLWLPLLWAAIVAARAGRVRAAMWMIAAGATPLLLWLPFAAGELFPYLAQSARGTQGVDSASQIPTQAQRFQLTTLMYYPAVLKDAVGWSGLAICLGAVAAWRLPVGRVLWLSMLGGLFCLALIGRREPRYLLPLLPVLFLAAELGWGRLRPRGAVLFLAALVVGTTGAQLWGTASAYAEWPEPRPLANLDFGPDNLTRQGAWPAPEPAFVPTSSLAEDWQVSSAVKAIEAAMTPGNSSVGMLLYAHPRVPPPDLYVLEAAHQGWGLDWVSLEILSANQAGPPPPEVRVGRVQGSSPGPQGPLSQPHLPPHPPHEERFTVTATHGPVSALMNDARFVILYTVHPRGEPFYREFFFQLRAEEIHSLSLPRGFVGKVWRLDEAAWDWLGPKIVKVHM